MFRAILICAVLATFAGCATPASSRLAAALDYVRALETADVGLYGRAIDTGTYRYIAPRPGHPRDPLVLRAEEDDAALRGIGRLGAPRFSSLRLSEEKDGTVEVSFELEVGSRRHKADSAGTFSIEGVWRMTVTGSNGTYRVAKVEEVPRKTSATRPVATFGTVKTLHAGNSRPIAAGGCKPDPCDGIEYVDSAGRTLVKEIWRISSDGIAERSSFVDGAGRPFANHAAE